MAMRCESCSKGVMYGHNVSHSKRRTTRVFKPNLHTAKIAIGSTTKKLKLCTKCLRMFKSATIVVPTKTVKVVEAQVAPVVA
jgi:large subunit ribosomal protein L28